MKLVITTQFRENYGAHDWDGKGECPSYWKNKGGSTYVVEDLKESHRVKINMDGIPTLSSLIEYSSNYASETIIGYSVEDDDYNPFEEWETQNILTYQIDYEGDFRGNKWVCRQITNIEYSNEVDRKICSYDMLDGGQFDNYECSYRSVKDGNWYTEEEIIAMRKAA